MPSEAHRSSGGPLWALLGALAFTGGTSGATANNAVAAHWPGLPGFDEWLAGDYPRAYELAVVDESAAAQLLAAQAAADHAVYVAGGEEAESWLVLSAVAAERALQLEPAGPLTVAALLAHARALGEGARYRGLLSSATLPGQLRGLFEQVLELDPENPDALVALGAWNLELADRGVGWLYGASRDAALPLIERGLAYAPDRINLRAEHVRALVIIGECELAREQLQAIAELPISSATDAAEQRRIADQFAASHCAP